MTEHNRMPARQIIVYGDCWPVTIMQNDMADVREHLLRYHLTLETRPRHGMKLFGGEMAIRACLTDL
ncbi:helix-turn-helix domain-containing protein, partial [Salmonella enterica subsp. enterica serovar Kentucky]|nr:helix-turn-helix domain-containing protein [Salmonella enterica subsp. enterica serovar Kentucky]